MEGGCRERPRTRTSRKQEQDDNKEYEQGNVAVAIMREGRTGVNRDGQGCSYYMRIMHITHEWTWGTQGVISWDN